MYIDIIEGNSQTQKSLLCISYIYFLHIFMIVLPTGVFIIFNDSSSQILAEVMLLKFIFRFLLLTPVYLFLSNILYFHPTTTQVSIYFYKVKNAPALGRQIFYIEIYRKNFEDHLVTKYKAQSLDIWSITLSSGPLPRVPKLSPWAQECPNMGSNILHSDNKGKISKTNCSKVLSLELRYLVYNIVLGDCLAKITLLTRFVKSMAARGRGSFPHI